MHSRITGNLHVRELTRPSSVTGYSAIVMTSRLRALGGRINIRTSELPKEKTRSEVVCGIRFLDGSVQTFKVNVSSPTSISYELMPPGNNFFLHLINQEMEAILKQRLRS